MKDQPKLKKNKLVFFLMLLFFALGCNPENRQKGYFLVNYSNLNDGITNMLLCKIENYNPKKNITYNLKRINKMPCIAIAYSPKDENYKYIKQLKQINKENKFKSILCKIDFEITDTHNIGNFFYTKDVEISDSFTIENDYYILSSIKNKIIFHQFQPIENAILK